MKINKEESEIIGQWIFDGAEMHADYSCKRIDWLRNNYLTLIATDESGWLKLYRDPEDKRYWQLDFPFGEMHGGGPPILFVISEEEATLKFNL